MIENALEINRRLMAPFGYWNKWGYSMELPQKRVNHLKEELQQFNRRFLKKNYTDVEGQFSSKYIFQQ